MFSGVLLYLSREGKVAEVQCYDSLKGRRDGNGDVAGDPPDSETMEERKLSESG